MPFAPVSKLNKTRNMGSSSESPCRTEPPPELFAAAEHLARIAELLEAGEVAHARAALYEMPGEQAHWYWMNATTLPFHRHEDRIPSSGNVSSAMRVAVGNRDHWHCRYCDLPVADVSYFSALYRTLPEDFPQARGTPVVGNGWPISRVFCMAPDHVVPLAAGGPTTMENLATACGACNYQWKGDCTLEELGGELHPPVERQWDGLLRRPRLP